RLLMPFLTTLFEPQKKHFFYHINEFLYKDMYFSALQRFHPTFCPPCRGFSIRFWPGTKKDLSDCLGPFANQSG
ncbi:MAG: hypothetical protein IKZ14_04770, partial [Muribaculaceae bacterium]|nr:hypothetical protein [Muribaculaceae bacterium]